MSSCWFVVTCCWFVFSVFITTSFFCISVFAEWFIKLLIASFVFTPYITVNPKKNNTTKNCFTFLTPWAKWLTSTVEMQS